MVNTVNWDMAPEDATHHGFVNNPEIICWYKYENTHPYASWAFWYSEDGILDSSGWNDIPQGQRPLALPLTPRPTFVAPPIVKNEWIPGETLPPVGSVVSLKYDLLGEHSSLYKIDSFEGDEVEILAHYTCDNNVDVAVYIVTGQGGKFVKQGIAKLFKPVETPEEKKEKQRTSDLIKLHTEFNIDLNTEVSDLITQLYDNGRLAA